MTSAAQIRVTVGPGMFATERLVAFSYEGQQVEALVDESWIEGDQLKVLVIERREGQVMIEVPGDVYPASRSNRMTVPETLLTP